MQLRAGWELVDRVVNETVIEVKPGMVSACFRSFLARIIHDQCWLHEQSALWASTAASSGLRSRLALSGGEALCRNPQPRFSIYCGCLFTNPEDS